MPPSALCVPLIERGGGRGCYTVQPWRPWYSRLSAARFNDLQHHSLHVRQINGQMFLSFCSHW